MGSKDPLVKFTRYVDWSEIRPLMYGPKANVTVIETIHYNQHALAVRKVVLLAEMYRPLV